MILPSYGLNSLTQTLNLDSTFDRYLTILPLFLAFDRGMACSLAISVPHCLPNPAAPFTTFVAWKPHWPHGIIFLFAVCNYSARGRRGVILFEDLTSVDASDLPSARSVRWMFNNIHHVNCSCNTECRHTDLAPFAQRSVHRELHIEWGDECGTGCNCFDFHKNCGSGLTRPIKRNLARPRYYKQQMKLIKF